MTKGALPNQNPYAVLGVKDNTPNPYDPSALGIRSNVQGIPSVNPYASLGQRQKNPVQQTLDVIKNNPAVKTVNVKQTDGSTKIYTKDQYVAEQDKLNSGAITQGKTPALSFNKLDFKSGQATGGTIQAPAGHGIVGMAERLVGGGFNQLSRLVSGMANKLSNLFDTTSSDGTNLSAFQKAPGFSKYNADGSLNTNFNQEQQNRTDYLKAPENQVTPAQKIGAAAEVLGAAAGFIPAWLAFSVEINAAKESGIPVISQAASTADKFFQAIGKPAAALTEKTVGILPISDQSKEALRQPLADLASQASMIYALHKVSGGRITDKLDENGNVKSSFAGKVADKLNVPQGVQDLGGKVVGAVQKTFNSKIVQGGITLGTAPFSTVFKGIYSGIESRIKTAQKAGEDITPEKSQQIVTDVVKHTPVGMDGVMKVDTDNGKNIPVHTDNLLVLKNLIKGQEDLNYKQVKSLGYDNNGNPAGARFEWDYKNQEGTVYTTNQTNASELAHEFGHYLDRNMASKVGEKLSDLLPDYKENKSKVDGALAGYAVNKLMVDTGTATKLQISRKIGSFVDKFQTQVEKLAVANGETRDTFSEKFASAVSQIMNDPNGARKLAPDFTDFIQHNLQFFGWMQDRIKAAAAQGEKVITEKKNVAQHQEEVKNGTKFQNVTFSDATGKEVKVDTSAVKKEVDKVAKENTIRKNKDEITLYHGTTNKSAKEINKKGFDFNKTSGGSMDEIGVAHAAFTDDLKYAQHYGSNAVQIKGSKSDFLDVNSKQFMKIEDQVRNEVATENDVAPEDLNNYDYAEQLSEAIQNEGYQGILQKSDGAGKNSGKNEYIVLNQDYVNEKLKGQQENAVRTKEATQETRPKEDIGLNPKAILVNSKGITSKSFNSEKINTPEDVIGILNKVADNNKQFANVRRQTTLQEMKDFSKEFLGSPDMYKSLPNDLVKNRGKMLAARQMMVDLASELSSKLKSVKTETATPAQMTDVRNSIIRLEAAQRSFAGARTEASHLFMALKTDVSPGENTIFKELIGDLKDKGLEKETNIGQFMKKTKELTDPTVFDKFWHVWYSAVLSGPSTHLKNLIGNLSSLAAEIVRTGLQDIPAVVAGKKAELPAQLAGLWEGLQTGFKSAKEIFKYGQPSKFEERGIKPITFKGKASFLNYLDYVGRALSASDVTFREGFKNMELRGMALDQAKKEGLQGEKLIQKAEEIYQQKRPENIDAADQFAARGVFMSEPRGFLGWMSNSLSKLGTVSTKENRAASEAFNAILGAIKTGDTSGLAKIEAGTLGKVAYKSVIKTIVPFTRVVGNVVNVGLDYSPVGFLREGLYKEALKGVIDRKIPEMERVQKQQLARAVMGSSALMFFGTLAAAGQISGTGPLSTSKRKELEATGWRANSIKIGNVWYPYIAVDVLAVPMAIVANYFDASRYGNIKEDDMMKRLSVAVLGSAKTITDMSFLSGTSQLMAAINDPQGAGSSYLKRFAASEVTSIIPNGIKQVMKLFDSTSYTTNNIKEQLLSNLRITGGLKPALNQFGQETKVDILSNLQPHMETSDETLKYIAGNDLWVSIPSKATQVRNADGTKREMTSEEYYNYVKYSGQLLKSRLDDSLDNIKSIDDHDQQQKLVDSIVNDSRTEIKNRIQYGEQFK